MKPLILIVIGTRPEIIKTFPLIAPLKKFYNVKILFTGQHFSAIMSDAIFKNINYPTPDFFLKIKSFNHSIQVGEMVASIGEILIKLKPKIVLVQGDTNSTLAGALAASKEGIKLVHIEAGARCYNKREPEEVNRIIVDHIADLNFTFSKESLKNLHLEGIKKNIYSYPNTVYETCSLIKNKLNSTEILNRLNLKKNEYILSTIHRKSNLNKDSLINLFHFLNKISDNDRIIFLVHPKTKIFLEKFKIKISSNIILLTPVNYKDFLILLKNSKYIISDSGGVVDESCFFKRPLFIYRTETERNDIVKKRYSILISPNLSLNKKISTINQFLKTFRPSKRINYDFCKQITKTIYQDKS